MRTAKEGSMIPDFSMSRLLRIRMRMLRGRVAARNIELLFEEKD